MGIEIKFSVAAWSEKKPIVTDGRCHVLVTDGCDVNIQDNMDLSGAQRHMLRDEPKESKLRRVLFKANTRLMEGIFQMYDGMVSLKCPGCGNSYAFSKEQYNMAFNNFKETLLS